MKQLIDFRDLSIGEEEEVYPTDIDALIEYKDSEYIVFEIKYGNAKVPYGQRLALQRMIDDFKKAGKQAIAFICEHKVRNTNTPVVAARCRVREIYDGLSGEWKAPESEITLKDAVDKFQKTNERKEVVR